MNARAGDDHEETNYEHVAASLDRDGFAPIGTLLSRREVDALRGAIAQTESESDAGHGPYGILQHNPWCLWPIFAETMQSATLLAVVREVLGTKAPALFQDVLVWKSPNTFQRIEWHQDYAYWPLDRPRGLTMWVALDDADEENGCLHYLSGTHREGERAATDFVDRSFGGVQRETSGSIRHCDGLPPLDPGSREQFAIAVPLRAGEALVHHPLTWHMSPANLSTRHRRAWSLTWIHPDVCWDPDHAPHPYNWSHRPVRGRVPEGNGIWRPGD